MARKETDDGAEAGDMKREKSMKAEPKSRKYQRPGFLENGGVTQDTYERWLDRKADAHAKRNRKRGNATAIREADMIAIHRADTHSHGRDHYTDELLDWSLLSRYSNVES